MGFGGASGGGNPISSASDVALNAPSTNQALLYDGTTGKWKNGVLAGAIEFSPYEYGYTDNMANATASIQATLNAAMVSGGVVKLPVGTINVTTLNVDYASVTAQPSSGAPYGYAGPVIQGQGMRASKLMQIAGSTGNVLNIKGKTGSAAGPANNNKVTGCFINDIEIVGTSTGGYGVYIQSAVNCGMNRVWIRNTGDSGVYLARETFTSAVSDEYMYALSFHTMKIVSTGGWGIECSGTNSIGASFYDIETITCAAGGFKLAPTNMTLIGCQSIGCGTGSINGRGLLTVRNTNTPSQNTALNLIGFRAEGNSQAGGYEIEFRGGAGYTIIGANILCTNKAHGIGIGVQNTGVTDQFTQELYIDGGFITVTQSVTATQKAIVLGSDARKTVIRPPRFQNGANPIDLATMVTDSGFSTTVIAGLSFADVVGGTGGGGTTPPSTGGTLASMLASANTTPVNILVIGDSMAEGTRQSSANTRWMSVAQNSYNSAANVTGFFRYIPAYYEYERVGAASPSNQGFDLTNGSLSTTRGFGRRSWLMGTTATAVYSHAMGKIEVFSYHGSATDTISVSIDGAAATSLSGSTTGSGTGTGFTWVTTISGGERKTTLTLSSDATHTLTVAGTAGNATFEGAAFYSGQMMTKGVRFWDSTKHGTMTYQYINGTGGNTTWAGQLATVNPDIILSAHITNDVKNSDGDGNQILASVYKADQQALVTYLRSVIANVPIVFFPPWQVTGTINESWANYMTALTQLVGSNANTAAIKISDYVPFPVNSSYFATSPADAIHPNDTGAGVIATTLTDHLGSVTLS